MITINKLDKLCLIDLSYYVFYRYFALRKWMSYSEKELSESELLEKFEKLFISNLKKTCKQLNVKPKNTILVGDCLRSDIWRNSHYPNYKQLRESTIHPKMFPIVYDRILPALKDFQFISMKSLEADDICFILSKHLENDMVILTNDNDYLQMIRNNLDIVNLPSYKSICARCNYSAKEGLLNKVLTGDPSDNISGLVSKAVAKTLIQDDEKLQTYLKFHNLEGKYNLNKLLIDMNNIPEDLKNNVLAEIKMF
jgi:5'-3' exonuclease